MLLQKLNLNKILIVILIAIDIFLCFLLIRQHREYERKIYDIQAEKIFYADALKGMAEFHANIGTLELAAELDSLGLIDEVRKKNAIGLFIPPHPCESCMEKELDLLFHFYQESGHNILLISSSHRNRDLQALFGLNAEKIVILSYEIERMKYLPLKQYDGLVYFIIDKGSIEDVFVANKNVVDASAQYLQKYAP